MALRIFFTCCVFNIIWACEGLYDAQDFERESVAIFKSNTLSERIVGDAPALKTMAWNIKYGAGRLPFWFDCFGDRVQMTLAEVESNMEGIESLIRELDPDIFMAEEIEINSRRSA